MHVLVVDDERAVREALDRALRTHGYDVSTAEHGLAALEAPTCARGPRRS